MGCPYDVERSNYRNPITSTEGSQRFWALRCRQHNIRVPAKGFIDAADKQQYDETLAAYQAHEERAEHDHH